MIGVLAAAACTAFTVAVPGMAGTARAGEPSAAQANARWLARQLGADGTLRNPNGGTLPDHGLMIDALFAMRAAGEGKLADPIVEYLDDGKHATDYYTWDGLVPNAGYDAVITGGAAAKVLVAAEVAGRDPRRFGGHDMVAEVQGAIMRTGPDRGRVSDYSKNPDLSSSVYNNSNMFGQALGVIGLAGAGENDRLALDALLSQQCSDGYFRIFFDHTADNTRLSTCDEDRASGKAAPDGDATAMSLSALLAARKAGATGLDGPIAKTVAWLKGRQSAGGGWGGGVSTEAPNTNSTGLVVQALADAGDAKDAVDKGTAYLKSAQVTSADSGNRLADQVGAIAYTPDQYQGARDSGITGTDTWVRAGAQASLGLSQVGFYNLVKGTTPGGDGDGEAPGGGDGNQPQPGGGGNGNQPSKPGGNLPLPKPRPGAGPPSVAPPSGRTGSPAPPPSSNNGGGGGGDKKTANPQNKPVVTPTQSQAQPAVPTSAGRLGSYLAGKLVDGDHIEVTEGGRTYVDYDATADVVFALRSLGEQPVAVTRASRFLLVPESVKAYAYGVPYEKTAAAYAEPLAKLQLIARFLQYEPAAPKDLATTVAGLRDGLARLRTAQGHFVDTGAYGSPDTSVRRQAWAVLATTAGASPGDAAVPLSVLLKSQCADGTFPAVLGTSACATGDVTATAAAIASLNAGPRGDVTGVADASAVQVAARLGSAPAAWSRTRRSALVRAVTGLGRLSGGDGVVHGAGGTVDVARSADAATGRLAAGLSPDGVVRVLGTLLRPDGGFAKPGGTASDVPTSIAAAPGVSGRSWLTAQNSPVALSVQQVAAQSPATSGSGWRTSTWLLASGSAALAAVLVGGGVYFLSRRKRTRRARSSGSSAAAPSTTLLAPAESPSELASVAAPATTVSLSPPPGAPSTAHSTTPPSDEPGGESPKRNPHQ
ncbi:hypothetical protein AB0L06_34740 [Spirillospora sp. NPDC052269]